jgi:poly-gamma-glutamate synthesis protein (capsule biosynthesis protein)
VAGGGPSADGPSSSGPTAGPTEGGRRVTVLGAGDVLVHPQVWHQARQDGGSDGYDFFPMFRGVSATISGADLAICHLETPLAAPSGPLEGFPRFSVPPQVALGIKRAGFDACSTASNHAIDQGEAGVGRTLDALDRAGLRHTGTFRTATDAAKATIYTVDGVKIGHLSYSLHFNGLARPTDKEWLANLIDPRQIIQAARATRRAGAEIVVLSLHWGTEYQHRPDVAQRNWARALAGSHEIDLVLGHHAHAVQPIERISGTWVVFGMGNELARHAEPINDNREGIMARVTFAEVGPHRWKITTVEALPTWVDLDPDIRLIDLSRSVDDPGVPASERRIYRAALDRIRTYVLGTAPPAGVRVVG